MVAVAQIVQVLFRGVDAGVGQVLDGITTKSDKATKSWTFLDKVVGGAVGFLAAKQTVRLAGEFADEIFRAGGLTKEWDEATKGLKDSLFAGIAQGLGPLLQQIIDALVESAPTMKRWGESLGEGINIAIDGARQLYNLIADLLDLQKSTLGLSRSEGQQRLDEIQKRTIELQTNPQVRRGTGELAPQTQAEIEQLATEKLAIERLMDRYDELDAIKRTSATSGTALSEKEQAALAKQQQALERQIELQKELYTVQGGLARGADDVLEKWARIGEVTRRNVTALADSFQSELVTATLAITNNLHDADKAATAFGKNMLKILQELAAKQLVGQLLNLLGGLFGAPTSGGSTYGGNTGLNVSAPPSYLSGPASLSGGPMGFGGGGGITIQNNINLSRHMDAVLVDRQDLLVSMSRHALAHKSGYRAAVKGVARR